MLKTARGTGGTREVMDYERSPHVKPTNRTTGGERKGLGRDTINSERSADTCFGRSQVIFLSLGAKKYLPKK